MASLRCRYPAFCFVVCTLTLCSCCSPLVAGERVALVIGNSKYRRAPLRNPVNDARLMTQVLRQLDRRGPSRGHALCDTLRRLCGRRGRQRRPGGVRSHRVLIPDPRCPDWHKKARLALDPAARLVVVGIAQVRRCRRFTGPWRKGR